VHFLFPGQKHEINPGVSALSRSSGIKSRKHACNMPALAMLAGLALPQLPKDAITQQKI
jgi:hypothetical protein